MSESDADVDTSNSVKIPRFHGRRGDDYNLWRHRLREACRIKNLWGVVHNQNTPSDATQDTPSPSPIDGRTLAKREKACGIIISALGDAPLRVVMDVDDDPRRMMELLDSRYASNRTVSRIAVQTQLFRMRYNGQSMSEYVDQYTALFALLERMGKDASIPESHKAPMLLASIDPSCSLESTAAALRTKEVSELTWEYVATTLIDEYNAKVSRGGSSGNPKKSKSKRRNGSRSANQSGNMDNNGSGSDDSDLKTVVRALAAQLRKKKDPVNGTSPSNKYHCNFCNKSGHTEDRCFDNPSNPNNKLSPKIRQMIANVVQ